ncbi:hypothetical protein GAY28_01625 [Azospirillum brasilense]|nr:hypothetical protein [Azospirillum brasilense]
MALRLPAAMNARTLDPGEHWEQAMGWRETKAGTAKVDVLQLLLFELPSVSRPVLPGMPRTPAQQQRSHYVEMYDLAPRFLLYANEEARADGSVVKNFIHRGAEYELSMLPARVRIEDLSVRQLRLYRERQEKRDGEDVAKPRKAKPKGDTVALFPGEREQLVEEVVRRLAVQRGRTSLESNGLLKVVFTLREAEREMRRINHTFNTDEIREALNILKGAEVKIQGASGKPWFMNPISDLGFSEPGQSRDEDAETFVVFNGVLTEAIAQLRFRQVNYDRLMSIKDPFSRWIYKRLALSDSNEDFVLRATEFARDSGFGQWAQWRDAVRRISSAVNKLVAPDILEDVEIIRETQGKRIVDEIYVMKPTKAFVHEIQASRAAQEENLRRLAAVAGEDGQTGFIPIPAAQADLLRRDSETLLLDHE